jgi:insertion element IS1 protein InsB
LQLLCFDSYVVYPLMLAGRRRHWTAALRRRPIVVSKSLSMIKRLDALFTDLHVKKEAAPEMYRLPIQTGKSFATS